MIAREPLTDQASIKLALSDTGVAATPQFIAALRLRAELTARASGERVWEGPLLTRRNLRGVGNRLTESAG